MRHADPSTTVRIYTHVMKHRRFLWLGVDARHDLEVLLEPLGS
jgi:hypothetical protein